MTLLQGKNYRHWICKRNGRILNSQVPNGIEPNIPPAYYHAMFVKHISDQALLVGDSNFVAVWGESELRLLGELLQRGQ